MSNESLDDESRRQRRQALRYLLAGGASAALLAAAGRRAAAGISDTADERSELRNPLLWALAWKQTAAEFRALCYQAYNLARLQLDRALAEQRAADKPLDTSDKSSAREAIARRHRVPFLIGDNLNDYRRDYYVSDVEQRLAADDRP